MQEEGGQRHLFNDHSVDGRRVTYCNRVVEQTDGQLVLGRAYHCDNSRSIRQLRDDRHMLPVDQMQSAATLVPRRNPLPLIQPQSAPWPLEQQTNLL